MRAFATVLALSFVSSALAAPSSSRAGTANLFDLSAALSTPGRLANTLIDVLAHSAATLLNRPSPLDISRPASLALLSSSTEHVQDADEEEMQAYAEEYYAGYEAEVMQWEEQHAECADVCRVRVIEGAVSGRQALCSAEGLESTLECAQCIDMTWPESTYDKSAMAEFDRIAKNCQLTSESAQVAL